MPPMSTLVIHTPTFHTLSFNWSHNSYKFPRTCSTWAMDFRFSLTVNNNNSNMKKEEEVSVKQLSKPLISKLETLRPNNLQFDRLQPSDQELGRENKFEFGNFVAREAILDEEYWTAAWLRAESQWENRMYERYADNFKRKFAEQVGTNTYYFAQCVLCANGVFHENLDKNSYFLGIQCSKKAVQVTEWGELCMHYHVSQVKKEQKNVKRSILKSIVGTLDLNIRYLLQGETFPGERVKAPHFCSIKRTPPSRYGYISNLCVAKSARRQGIASNTLYFAVQAAKSNGMTQLYVHVDRNNIPAQILYQKMGFEMVETANSQLLLDETYLLRLQM